MKHHRRSNRSLLAATSEGRATTVTHVAEVCTVMALCLGVTSVLFGQEQLLVTNTQDAGQGSLRQAILDANGSMVADDIVFSIPDSDPGYNGKWWTITLSSPLPDIVESGTRILGSTQSINQGDTNPGAVGTGGTVGVDQLPLPMYERPEIAIDASGFDGLSIDGEASDVLVEGLSIYHAVNGIVAEGSVEVGLAGTNRRIHGVLIGTMPDGSDPGDTRNTGHGIALEGATSISDVTQLSVDSSYVGHNGEVGIVSVAGRSYIEVTGCEVFENGWATDEHDGIDVNGVGGIVSGNLSWGNTNLSGVPNPRSGNGIEAGRQETPGTGDYQILNNTLMGNLSSGISFRAGASFSFIAQNVVTANAVGISVSEDGDGTTAHDRFAQNEIYANAMLGIDLNAGKSDAAFDGVTLNSPTSGTEGANLLVPYPVITKAVVTDRVLRIEGFASPGGMREIYESDSDSSGFGEGKRFIAGFTEGLPGVDLDDSEGTYGPEENGVTVSTEALQANKFAFTYELGDEESEDMVLTATQSLPTSPCLSCFQVMSTSEFGPNIRTEIGSNVATEPTAEPTSFKLYDAYPNPFNPATTIRFDLDRTGPVLVRIYGADGAQRETLVDGTLAAGSHTVTWDASALPSGIYFYRLETGGDIATRSVLLLK